VPKTPAFAVVRFDDYLTKHTTDVSELITVVKVLLDIDRAEAEAQRLNVLKGGDMRYWVQTTRLVTSE
jgi:DNA-binding response OmpR family regulator